MTIDIDHLKTWIGSSEATSETIAPFPSNALAATLDRADPTYVQGTDLPPLWHWLHFLPVHPLGEAGPDGHMSRGGFLPPVPLPRRMWAGSRISFPAPLRIGDAATKTSTVRRVEMKQGKTGPLVFVTVGHTVTVGGRAVIEEEHDIVYRENAATGALPPTPPLAPDGAQFERTVTPDPVLLFRYSALTFTSHRIHYDQPYVTGVEGYPGLIVHGPRLATLMLDALRRAHADRRVAGFS
ncbi:MAG: FAS1-like dehydratase domain-containing protein, partial [Beijerinckiaceae bacterium]